MTLLPIDPIVAYALCGAGSLLGAAMMPLVRAGDAATRLGTRLFTAAMLAVGFGMLPLMFHTLTPPPWAVFVAALGGVAGTVLVAWGFRAFDARAVPGRAVVASVIFLAAVLTAAWLATPRAYALAIVGLTGAAGVAMLLDSWRVLRHPRDRAEGAMSACIALFGVVNLVRLAFTLAYEGPQRVHELYVPEGLLSLFSLYFATLPVAVALLVVNLVNSRLNARLQERATTDELTTALTRRALIEAAPRVLQRAEHDGRPMAAMMIDIDHFKAINDRHGHATGDSVLRSVAATLRQQLRPDALLARWGGEEFVIVLGVDDERATRLVAERLRRAVEADHAGVAATVSIGVSWFVPGDDLALVLSRADAALYRAKRGGRNRVEFSVSRVTSPGELEGNHRQGDGQAG